MSGQTIAVNPEALEGTAQRFYEAETQLQTAITKLCTAMETLLDEWNGVTQQKFHNKWHNVAPDFTEFPGALRETGTQLERIAAAFREADRLESWYYGL